MLRLQTLRMLARLFGLVAGFTAFTAAGEDAAFGPAYHQFKLTLDGGERTEIAGPFFYREEVEEYDALRHTWAIPPLISYSRNHDLEYKQIDLFWKVISYSIYGEEYRFQIAQLFSFAGGSTQSETNVNRFTVFPFYFQQRSAIPEKNYTAFLPFYGTIKQRLNRDQIRFAAFPLWVESRRRDVVTDNYLFPVFHLRHGNGLNGWQVWPLFGWETKRTTWLTNVWDEALAIGGHRKMFALWPLFHDHSTGLGTTNKSRQQAFLPLYSWQRSPLRDSTTFPWPIGYTHTIDRERKYEEWGAPWPLVVFARGEGKRTDRVWPFYSHATNKFLTGRWYMWPIYKYNRILSPPLNRERTRILFFLYSDLSVKHLETGQRRRRRDLWPLFTSTRELDGRRRLQILAPVEPIIPNSTSLQRDLSPLWSLWRAEHNPTNNASSQSLLWNLYRRDVRDDARKCSLLFGLIQYESGADGKRWRLFHIPLGKKKPAGNPVSK
jgi:hypothetical protein